MKVLLIIPAYNEEENIEKVVARIDEFRKSGCSGLQLDYVIINDGSTDNTLQICRKNNFNVVICDILEENGYKPQIIVKGE